VKSEYQLIGKEMSKAENCGTKCIFQNKLTSYKRFGFD